MTTALPKTKRVTRGVTRPTGGHAGVTLTRSRGGHRDHETGPSRRPPFRGATAGGGVRVEATQPKNLTAPTQPGTPEPPTQPFPRRSGETPRARAHARTEVAP